MDNLFGSLLHTKKQNKLQMNQIVKLRNQNKETNVGEFHMTHTKGRTF